MAEREKTAANNSEETREEIIGVLTAISIVSKRLARRLTMLDRTPAVERRAEGGSHETNRKNND